MTDSEKLLLLQTAVDVAEAQGKIDTDGILLVYRQLFMELQNDNYTSYDA